MKKGCRKETKRKESLYMYMYYEYTAQLHDKRVQ